MKTPPLLSTNLNPETTSQSEPPWLMEFILVAAIWGTSFMFQRLAVGDFGSLALTLGRVASATLFLLPFLHFKGLWKDYRAQWWHISVVGILSCAVPFLCYAFALQHIASGLAGILNATVPLFGAVIAWIWLGDKPNFSRSIGLAIGFGGIVMLSLSKANFSLNASGWAVLACLVATLCYGLSATYVKRHLTGVHPIAIATGSQISATIVLLPAGVWAWPATSPSTTAWLAMLAVGILCTGIAYILYYQLIEKIGPSRTMPLTFVIPVFAVVIGALVLGETITLAMVIWGGVILLGTSLATGLWRVGSR
jgi:drug/metabolite transporter (DMT)-like permease